MDARGHHFAVSVWALTDQELRVFVHVFDWPAARLELVGLDAKVIAAHLLATGQALTFRQNTAKLQIDIASTAPDPNVSMIVLTTL